MTTDRRFEYEIDADYHQFYIQDEKVEGDLSDSWTEETVRNLLATAPGTIGVGTVRNGDVAVVVEVSSEEPNADFEEWDHITECSLEVSSGRIVVAGCTEYFEDAARIDLASAMYRARVSYGKLDSLDADGLEGDDHYRVQLWPAVEVEQRVLKARSEPS